MPSTIADLPDGVTTQGTDRLPIARAPYGPGDNRQSSAQQLKNYISIHPDVLTTARTYHVRNSGPGNDSNDGLSPAAPFFSFAKFTEVLKKIDQGGPLGVHWIACLIYPGTYDEKIVMPHNLALTIQRSYVNAVDTSWNPLPIPGNPTTVVFRPTTPGDAVLNLYYNIGFFWYNVTFDASHTGFHQAGTAFKPCLLFTGGTTFTDADFISCRCVMPDNAVGTYVIQGAGEIGTANMTFKMNGTYGGIFNGYHLGSGGPTVLEQVGGVDATVVLTDAFFGGNMYISQYTQAFNQFIGWSNTTGRKYRGSFLNVWPNMIDVIPGDQPGIVTMNDGWTAYQKVQNAPPDDAFYRDEVAPTVWGSWLSDGIPRYIVPYIGTELRIPDTWGVFRDKTVGSVAARLSLNSAGTIKSLIFDGEDVIVDADGRTISVSECGVTFTNEGAGAIDPFILPPARSALNYKFIVVNAVGIRVTAVGDDTIRVGASVSAAAGKVEATAVGSAITLIAVNASQWIATQTVGTWTTT